MLRRKFAVVKLWPKLKTAEDECIARLKITARSLGLECLEVDSFARLIDPPYTQLTSEEIDFVLSLHFETPKRYDIFSFVALWNPLDFFHEWGYRKFTRHMLTHDDFLSCDSPWADDHVRRSVVNDPMRDGPFLRLYHSLSEPLLDPETAGQTLFYAGINWERVGKPQGRHQGLLNLLDADGDLRIYGPKRFLNVDVWAGYKSYAGPVPFDGVSIVRLLHDAGISLVLSSSAHIESELMSSRLFESLAAGAVIICDENRFARRFFGDTLLYIDTTLPPESVHAQVRAHVDWIRSKPLKARELARQAQEIFRAHFTLDRCLENIYRELPARKEKLERLYTPRAAREQISLLLLMPEFDSDALDRHIESCLAQKNVDIQPTLVVDRRDAERFGHRLEARLAQTPVPIHLHQADYYFGDSNGSVRRRTRLGQVIYRAIQDLPRENFVCLVGPHERLFSDHLCSLLRKLEDSEDAGAAWSDMLLSHSAGGEDFADLSDDPAIHTWGSNKPLGFGRFLFRLSALGPHIETTLPYLDALPMYLLAGAIRTVPTRRCTAMANVQHPFNLRCTQAEAEKEREILVDYAPAVFKQAGEPYEDIRRLQPLSLSLEQMAPKERARLASELAHSIPWPGFLEKLAFGAYRLWLRTRK